MHEYHLTRTHMQQSHLLFFPRQTTVNKNENESPRGFPRWQCPPEVPHVPRRSARLMYTGSTLRIVFTRSFLRNRISTVPSGSRIPPLGKGKERHFLHPIRR